MTGFRPTGLRYCCALIACMPQPLDREPYIAELVRRTGYADTAIRRDVETIAATGETGAMCRKLGDGERATAQARRAEVTTEPKALGWWEAPQVEGEPRWDFLYRTTMRLPIARAVLDWGRFEEWWARSLTRAAEFEESTFDAEYTAWREMKREHEAMSVNRELDAIQGRGFDPIADLEDDWDRIVEQEDRIFEAAHRLGWEWFEEYMELVTRYGEAEAGARVLAQIEAVDGGLHGNGGGV